MIVSCGKELFMENELEDLRFNLTPKIQDLILEMLVIKQMLEEEKVEADKIDLLKKHQEKLKNEYVIEFRKNNANEIKKLLDLLDK